MTISPVVVFLDAKHLVYAVTGGRSAVTLWRWNEEGLPIHQRGEGKSARHFVIMSEYLQFLRDTSRTI